MNTRLLIIIGIVTTGVIASFLFFPNEQQNTCEQMGGIWNTDHCMITQETFDSNKLTCDPGSVLENGTCYRNGIKLVFETILDPELPDIHPGPVSVNDIKLNNQECARLFDKIFETWEVHVKENYGGPGQAILEPPSVSWLIADWEGGKEFRDSDCRYTVNDWAYLVEHQEQVWGSVDWPKLEPFSYTKSEVIEERFRGITKSQIEDIQLAELGCKKIGNQTYCDIMIQEKIDYYLQLNHGEIENEN